ncbi:MAG: hypothetical protein IPH32_19235 [Bacteroidetes bacterium]|nr:hypothetical protein [Bacteroidota bacterium]
MVYIINLPNGKVDEFKKLSNIKSVEPIIEPKGEYSARIFPHDSSYKWNNDNALT